MAEMLVWEWLNFGLRWLHVVAAIAWIGSSFYFIALDLGLRRHSALPHGVMGEAWQVHGGGFYHMQKYGVAPDHMPEDLTWFKWEAYTTWLSGFALLCVMYYAGAELYLIDHANNPMPVWQAVAIGLAALVSGWLIYDRLCKSRLGHNDTVLFVVLFVFLSTAGFALSHVFTGRGAFIHIGAMTATIMAANVAHIIIPNQRIVVADLIAGRTPDPQYGRIAKQRSLHNNYLTLPVIFLFLSNHYPLAYASRWNWAIIAVVLVMGAVIRHFFNTMHRTGRMPWWTWGAASALFAVVIGLSAYPAFRTAPQAVAAPVDDTRLAALMTSEHFEDAHNIILSRCSMCHAREPYWPGVRHAPLNVVLETEEEVARAAWRVHQQAVASTAMPPGNITYLGDDERRLLARWLADAR